MTDQYMKEILRVAVAQICQTIGYNATQTAPLELLQDVLDKFMREFTRDLRRQVEHYNRTDANLNDVTLTLSSINVNLNELLDYINNVEPVPFALEVPKFPARKESSLNFLKPGSKEVLTRPVHVYDHLPPMLPPEIIQPSEPALGSHSNNLTDTKSFQDNLTIHSNGEQSVDAANTSLNPNTVLDKTTLQSLFKPSTNFEDGERPTREVSSVVMTTGGYISPAVEGKMPEAMVPDIIDKLLGLDAPPPPPPPPPPPQSRPASRSANNTPGPGASENSKLGVDKDVSEREVMPSTSKESKKQALARNLEPQPISSKKLELLRDLPAKKSKLFNPLTGKNYPHDLHMQPAGNFNKKSFMMHQNAAGLQTPQTNYANMLLKKAKKQKVPIIPGQPLNEKHTKPSLNDKMGKMDAADKAHKKYMKMLQKMAKQGKIPPEALSNIMGSDKKSKMINPGIVASMPPGPEKLQLEKLLRKQAKQRQKMHKQQMMLDVQKQSKKTQQPPPLVPIFPPRMVETLSKPLHVDLEEQKHKMETKDLLNLSPVKSAFTPNMVAPISTAANHLPEALLAKSHKITAINETPPLDIMDVTPKPLLTQDGKELKLSNEPDRSKLNIFKKISKQKTPKSSSPTPLRVPGLCDTPIINLPSGTTITPAPGPSNSSNASSNVPTSAAGRNLFPPLNENPQASANSNIINVDDIKDKPNAIANINTAQPTDLSMLNRVFGEKAPEVELVNKPKKRGRKPGSKNSPKIPGVFPNNMLKKNSKKMKMDNSQLFAQQIPNQLPPDFGASSMGNLSFDNVAQLFGNPLNPMEWAQNKHLQQQMMIMAGAKERKEHKKKNKMFKQDLLNNDNNMATLNMTTNPAMGVPTNEEVQSINKKLMRMDTILKAAPTNKLLSDLTVDTSLITGKKLPSPAMFPSSTSPLKSPGNSKRLMAGTEAAAMANSLVQPFMLPNRSAFPNLPSSMLSMLQFPFPTRPGLIPTPGLFPTPGLGAFPNNPNNPLLPGLFPFPNLKQPMADNVTMNQKSEDLTTDKKKSDTNLQPVERSYCNVAPLVPDFLTKLNEQHNSSNSGNKHMHEPPHAHEPDLPKTPKPRNSHSNTLTHDNLLKKIVDAHTPESATGSMNSKSIPSTPGGMSLNTFEQLMKKNESPMDLMNLNKHTKSLSGSQESGLDFSMHKKPNYNQGAQAQGGLSIKTPITLNNEPIEVSDDSDETTQPPVPPPVKTQQSAPVMASNLASQHLHHNSFNMDDMFVANTSSTHMPLKSIETDLTTKELKKLKKQVKKSSSSINASLMSTDKTEGLKSATGSSGGVGKLAGGADLIPLTSTGLAYSSKNIPYNSLTANANPSFNSHKTEFNNTTAASSAATAPSSTSVFDNLTITAAISASSAASSNTVFDFQKKRKEHKKLKKLKDGKIKKKKDKKDKNKSKERAEKYLLNQTQTSAIKEKEQPALKIIPSAVAPLVVAHSSSNSSEKVKDKDLLKKLKKEKKKEKQRTVLEEMAPQNPCAMQQIPAANSLAIKESTTASTSNTLAMLSVDIDPSKKQKLSPALVHSSVSGNEHNDKSIISGSTAAMPTASIVPKLTLKLGSTHSPTPPRDDGHKSNVTSSLLTSTSAAVVQQPPPPPAVQSPSREHQREPSPELARISPLVTRPPKHKPHTSGELATSSSTTSNSISAANASSLEIGDSSKTSSSANPNMIVPPPSPWLSGGTISASSVLLPHQLLQTTKQHDMTTAPASAVHNTDTAAKTASTDRQSPLTLITETSRPSSYIDAEGNRVWICPACGKVDDGSPMIGCDGCDAWYHWVCVGIFVAPKDNEDWFCRVCITRKKGLHGSDKKRKRNKKK